MKLAMTLLVKNEIDIIETHVRFHMPQVDYLIVLDNLSTDGTYDKLMELKDEYGEAMDVLTIASQVYDQARWVSRMVRYCTNKGADWVINSDVDEFWIGDLKYVIGEFWKVGANIVYPEGTTFQPTVFDDPNVKDPTARLLYHDGPDVPFGSKKAVHATEGFSYVEQGNHYVNFLLPIIDHTQETPDLMLYHYPFRSEDQFVSKHQGKWDETKLGQMGIGWRSINNICVEGGEESLRNFYREQILFSEDKVRQRGLVKDLTVKDSVTKMLWNTDSL